MAKKQVAESRRKAMRLTVEDIPRPSPLPDSIIGLRDGKLHDITADAWRAASTLFRGIDFWRQWRDELNNNDDADPVVAVRLLESCSSGIFTLSTLGAFTLEFRSVPVDGLVSLLPVLQYPFRKDWQKDIKWRRALDAQLTGLYELQGECSMLMSQLEKQPSVTLGWGPDQQDQCGHPDSITDNPFIPNKLQVDILDALDGRALKKQQLANEVSEGEGTRIYRKGGIKELRKAGLVNHKSGVGYFRPDSPPENSIN